MSIKLPHPRLVRLFYFHACGPFSLLLNIPNYMSYKQAMQIEEYFLPMLLIDGEHVRPRPISFTAATFPSNGTPMALGLVRLKLGTG